MSRKLWVLPVSISTITLSFLIHHFNFRVCGWLMPMMVVSHIPGVLSPSRFNVILWGFLTSSFFYSFESNSSSFSASHVYNCFELSSMQHTCLESHFSPQCLHFPSFILWVSKLLLLSSRRFGGMYLSLFVFVV
jgi:hypothetical protein